MATETTVDETHTDGTGAGADGTTTHTEVAGGHDASSGLPQLDVTSYGNMVFWLVISFVAIYIILNRIALPRIGSTIETRVGTVQRDLDRAAEMRNQAKEAEARYEQALVDARNEAHAIAEKNKAKVDADLAKATAKADVEIAALSEESGKRLAEIEAEADKSVAQIAGDVVADIIDSVAPSANDDKAIKAALKQAMKGN